MGRWIPMYVLAAFLLGVGIAAAAWMAGSASSDDTTLLPASPLTDAPAFKQKIDAAGCNQAASLISTAGDGLVVRNTGTYPLRMNPAGSTAQPEWALAKNSWVHYVFRKPGTYVLTGTRVGACVSYPAPHFTLTIEVP